MNAAERAASAYGDTYAISRAVQHARPSTTPTPREKFAVPRRLERQTPRRRRAAEPIGEHVCGERDHERERAFAPTSAPTSDAGA